MIRLILMLMGVDFVRRRWRWLAAIGFVWAAGGVAIVFDALDGVLYFPIHLFAAVVLIEGFVSLAVTFSGLETQRRNRFRLIKGILFVVVALLLFDPYPDGNFIISMLMGTIFTIGGVLRISGAQVLRFSGWKLARFAGILELLFALLVFSPWPLPWSATVPTAIGLGLFLSGWGVIRVGLRLRRLPPYASVSLLTGRHGNETFSPLILAKPQETAQAPTDLIVHVWTPVGSAEGAVRRPIIDRYAAAVDAHGVISTGHAALEVSPDIYISHYPGVEIERSPDQFMQTLKATAENDIPGKFQPSYAEEAAGWCESTEKVVFREYDLNRLREFWASYRQDNTYNLTNRNCSSTVTHALETALEGVIGRRPRPWWTFFRMIHSPELWVAAELYERADTAAWTPGLTLDYARALHSVLHAPEVGWLLLVRRAWKAYANRAADRAKRSIKRAAT
jgi:uncharacterized membrane protein HdeD (DUF308 family)